MTEASRTVKVLVADDQVLIRAGLAALLRAAPGIEVVGEAVDGESAVALAAAERPDVVLMDIRMPGMDGIAATRQILADAGDQAPKVVVLTTFDIDEYVYEALRAGACGFLLKDTPPERLLAAISTVAAGDMLFAPTVTRRLIEAYAQRPQATANGADTSIAELGSLTARELEVLKLVGTGLPNASIADQLFISEATVKTHFNRTMTKLGLASRAQAVVVAYEAGLVTPRRLQP